MTGETITSAARAEAARRWPRKPRLHRAIDYLDHGMASGFVLGAQWASGVTVSDEDRAWEQAPARIAAMGQEYERWVEREGAEPPFFRDVVTGEPCPRDGALMCTRTDPDHLHRAIALDPPTPSDAAPSVSREQVRAAVDAVSRDGWSAWLVHSAEAILASLGIVVRDE